MKLKLSKKFLYTEKYVYSVQWTTDNRGKIEKMLKQEVKSSTRTGKSQGFHLRQLYILSFFLQF